LRSGANPDAVGELLLWSAVGLAAFVALALLAWWVRRRTIGKQRGGTADVLNLETLQRMRSTGTISEQEYKALRAAAIRSLETDAGGSGHQAQ
jgi:hypothetical protein